MNQPFFKLTRFAFIFLDLLMVNAAFVIAKNFLATKTIPTLEVQYLYLLMFMNFSWIISGWLCAIYSQKYISSFEPFCGQTLRAYIYFLALVMMYLFLSKQPDISRSFILTFFITALVLIFINRLIYLFLFYYFRNREDLTKKIVIVGYNDMSKRLVQKLEEEPINTQIIGYCEDEQEVHELSNYPILGGRKNVIEVSKQFEVTEIFSTISPEQDEYIYQLIQKAEQACIRFKLVPNFNFFANIPVYIDYFGNIPVLSLRREPLEDVSNRIKKRLYDVIISSLVAIFILSWLIPLIGMLIWFESGGPIFFVQKRSGKDNKAFGCLKFRSMKVNKESHTLQASRNDPRITKIGSFLRRTSLDEFPQFLNVLVGHMSIVGPRPHMLKHTNDYSAMINKYMVRQFMKPGISGWAQVNGFRGETRTMWDMEKRVEYDIWYMENWSLWLDTRVIFLTMYKVFTGDIKGY